MEGSLTSNACPCCVWQESCDPSSAAQGNAPNILFETPVCAQCRQSVCQLPSIPLFCTICTTAARKSEAARPAHPAGETRTLWIAGRRSARHARRAETGRICLIESRPGTYSARKRTVWRDPLIGAGEEGATSTRSPAVYAAPAAVKTAGRLKRVPNHTEMRHFRVT